MHMEVWSVLVAVALLLGFRDPLRALRRAACAGGRRRLPGAPMRPGLELYVVLLCALNFVSVVLQRGLGECHTFGYQLLSNHTRPTVSQSAALQNR